ncbi:hypothetical protein SAMN02910353_02886 [Ruminococcus sp. YRD2003]|nr:hypothetical protein SAMN02910353_02886 [Ruminococcus flavefaciens]
MQDVGKYASISSTKPSGGLCAVLPLIKSVTISSSVTVIIRRLAFLQYSTFYVCCKLTKSQFFRLRTIAFSIAEHTADRAAADQHDKPQVTLRLKTSFFKEIIYHTVEPLAEVNCVPLIRKNMDLTAELIRNFFCPLSGGYLVKLSAQYKHRTFYPVKQP